MILGHEASGVVTEVGADVTHLKVLAFLLDGVVAD